MSKLIINNVVTKDVMRKIQKRTLAELSDILVNSFGPNGSNSCIKKENILTRYTKDGHTIISAIQYNGVIEQSIKDDIESITRHIVKTVGDGTTSAVILSSKIFDAIVDTPELNKYQPSTIVKELEEVANDIKDRIMASKKELTIEDVYDIAMISTNGNEYVSSILSDIYKKFGTSVFIDVSPSIGEEFVLKEYDGMTINCGYADICYVTNTEDNTAVVDHPDVYFFEHPIDTKELGVYLDCIISNNIITPVNSKKYEDIVPTVIFAPKISIDCTSTMESLVSIMAQMPAGNKLPICIIDEYADKDQLADLAKMCGAKMIRKYIDAEMYKADVEAGRAPTPETIGEWAGGCDQVVAHSDKTVFVRPMAMFNEDGSYSNLYKNMLNFLETEVSRTTEDGEDAHIVGKLKRRLHSLKANMVEIFVGGITQADRDALRDLVEDAVLNIRSAASEGIGLGANMSGMLAVSNIESYYDSDDVLKVILARVIKNAYVHLVETLYSEQCQTIEGFIDTAIEKAKDREVYNLRTNEWTKNVKTSIMSDSTILDTVCKIVGIMATCNQFIVPSAMHNIYIDQ